MAALAPLKKGDLVVGVPDGAGGFEAVRFVVVDNRPRGHGLSVVPWMPNFLTVLVQRLDAASTVIDPVYGAPAGQKRYGEVEDVSGQIAYLSRYQRRVRTQMGEITETTGHLCYLSALPGGGPVYFNAELVSADDQVGSR